MICSYKLTFSFSLLLCFYFYWWQLV